MENLLHRGAGVSAQAIYSNKTTRSLRNLGKQKGARSKVSFVWLFGAIAIVSTVVLNWKITLLGKQINNNTSTSSGFSRVAFGSSTAREYGPQPVWVNGVIPTDPDSWIWLGDMAYLDEPRVSCDAIPSHPQCTCTSTWINQESCMAGNHEHAVSRMHVQLANPDYAQFLAFMCPGHREKGLHPPIGSDPSVCPKSILGTYNDHDYTWAHGNKRLPGKDKLKQVFLDAIGEPNTSGRRRNGHGIEWKHTLNQGSNGHEIDVILLDERYYRDPLPCQMHKKFCEEIIRNNSHLKHSWCVDFLESCCEKDERIFYGWCSEPLNKGSPQWNNLCNPSSPNFGKSTSDNDSSFCEILGKQQREWLDDTLLQSNAPLKLLVSSSVVLANQQVCTEDDWECYKPAQLSLLQSLATKGNSCIVILTGGNTHYSDIRVLKPAHSRSYGGISISDPLFQVMASGLTTSSSVNFTCDELRRDLLQLRDHSECGFARGPSFGMIEVAWEEGVVKLQIRDGLTSKIKLESEFSLKDCN